MANLLPIIQQFRTGTVVVPTPSDPSGTNSFENDGKTWMVIYNLTGQETVVVTVDSVAKCDGDLIVGPRIISVPAGTAVCAGYFLKDLFNKEDGTVDVHFSAPVGVCLLSIA